MFRILAALAALFVVASAVPAQLPEDGNRFHLITVTAETTTPYGAKLLSLVESSPDVTSIANLCHVHRWTPASKAYQLRYSGSLPPTTLPIVALAKPGGGVIYKASGPNVPQTGKALAAALIEAARAEKQSNDSRNQSVADCPCEPTQPASPRFPSIPGIRPLDQLIPDTVNVNPSVSLPEIPSWVYIAGGVILLLTVGGFLVVVALCGLGVFLIAKS